MSHQQEITSVSDIKLLVNSFYTEVRNDDLLAPVFNGVIEDRWPAHLEKMIRFWETVLLDGHSYSGRPFAPHASLPVNTVHFDRWLHLFNKVVDRHFSGHKAEEVKWRASKMATLFLAKIEYIQNNPGKVIL